MEDKGVLFQESLEKISYSFTLSGIPLKLSDKSTNKLRLIFLLNFLCINSDLLGAIHFFASGIAKKLDFVKLTYMAPCICFSFLANVKAFTMILYEKKIRELIINVIELEEIAKRYGFGDVYMKDRRSFHKVIFYFNVLYSVVVFMFALAPLLMTTLSYYEGNFKLVYPLFISYPFDINRLVWFPVVYIHQTWSVVIVLIFVSAADYFFYLCCLYISLQFKMLQRHFEKLVPENVHARTTYNDLKIKFESLVEWHQNVIIITNKLEAIYSKSSLYNFGSSSLLICLTLFNVTTIKDIAFVITFLMFLSMCLGQIYLLCFFGDKVTQTSTEVSVAAYNSLWYLCDASVGKQLLLVLIRSQKACKLTALGFADVNQRAFMRIMSNAWSYFALLKTMYP